jgi:hypothetical protein
MPAVKTISQVSIRNSEHDDVTFVLEPWGEIYRMPAGATFDVLGESDEDGKLEVEVVAGRITVYGWAGSTVEALFEGQELTPDSEMALQEPL